MSIYEEELEGREFDWFGIDSNGCIAMFATAGQGTIPLRVVESFNLHDEISRALDSPNRGSKEVWSDYSNLGFYVYDWHLHGGPYKRQCKPCSNIMPELESKIKEIAVVLDINFSNASEVVVVG